MNNLKFIFLFLIILAPVSLLAQKTEYQYLSGHGKDNTVDWEFFCTAGRNSGKWTTIRVPSNWECEGFGTFNYGQDKDELKGKEKGLYRYRFTVPENWKSKVVKIIFEGSMTDTELKINGKPAGPIHQGAFYRFSYDITSLLNFGKKNLLEVNVSKHSGNSSVNDAERRGDFWTFGGIYRPVYLEAKPNEHIDRIALDAKADGSIKVDAFLQGIQKAKRLEAQITTLNGQPVGNPFSVQLEKESDYTRLEGEIHGIKSWNPETPNLYLLELRLFGDNKIIHQVSERFGFRTVEIRDRDGFYVNGVKIKFKGINRHSFWPTSGRTTNKQISIDDVNLIKEMNMNSVRMSHYPPDVHFLDVCDSLGLFVLDELTGWQRAYDTEAGSKLAQELIIRDVNYPSIVIWDNGNEGGWNTELDHWFDELDLQKRPLIHPYQVFRKTDTDHYMEYNYGTGVHQNGTRVVFPTEFLHGLYDGGHGAGLEDYWTQMWSNPISAGGFLWDFSDQAVVRVDQNGKLDTHGNHGADGILGPYREKEGSFYTVREIWSPVFFEKRFITSEFNGQFTIENRYHYTNLKDCHFKYQLVNLPLPGKAERIINHESDILSPDIQPGYKGILQLNLPKNFAQSDVLYITATDPSGREIYTWSWPISLPSKISEKIVPEHGQGQAQAEEDEKSLTLTASQVKISWDKATGLLSSVENSRGPISFNQGPALIEGETTFKALRHFREGDKYIVESENEGAFKQVRWTFFPDGWLKLEVKYNPPGQTDFMGISFNYPENLVNGMRWMGYGPYRVWKNRMKGNGLDVWEKTYNNTITGESEYLYPEFKGYHRDFYWVTIQSKEQDFNIITATEGIFLRMFTPASPAGLVAPRIAPPFPKGDISFMHGIMPIGTKIWNADRLGPMSQKNIYSNRRKEYSKDIELYFDFTGKQK
ncbi:MAG: glycosyl transferase family 2 [Bacteroidetes bacterium GWF2_42_66]|nr:MAG: glycosyl transferase family 2 [Bacteroidetes bacterium GWA2_42_15]OFY02569.1 MAG: glycosyl transferase family 2 [Bacteroidetes bacterium GWE2_42_39]OFY41331.1 MAG: glycosyl transferase family 2 [Bacteroidetes bacterium GWF2_42_66]HAZ04940.1 glycoside hydrolase family 2 [Marinilabiliales bacterium]HBL75471.1 glycoside hydrolase family 2 [Prolixibacteraceae bacterium]